MPAPVAATNCGPVRGFIDEGVLVFKGIPYGEDTATRRFQPPVRPSPWVEARNTVAFGPQAPQAPRNRENRRAFAPMDAIGPVNSEDCLHLNVWTPKLRDGRRRPVLVYIPGSGYSYGSSNGAVFNGVRLVKRGNVVVVTLNHRINLFGYLYLREIGGSQFAECSNLGQLDLILALEWVRDNIAEFGGDPHSVCILGQGGGAAKCSTLMAMPKAKGLFHRAVLLSGQQVTAIPPTHATATANTLLASLGLKRADLAALADPEEFPMERLVAALQANPDLPFGPVRDGRTLPRDPFSPDAPLLSASIPMLVGTTLDETRLTLGAADPSLFSLQWEDLPSALAAYKPRFGALKVESLIAQYKQWYPAYSASDVFFAITTAFLSWHGILIESERRAQHARTGPTWVYEFDWESPVENGKWGASHSMDVPFLFDNLALAGSMMGSSPAANRLAGQMADALIAFASTGDPNASSIPKWPAYDLTQRPVLCWNESSEVKQDPRSDERKLLERVPFL